MEGRIRHGRLLRRFHHREERGASEGSIFYPNSAKIHRIFPGEENPAGEEFDMGSSENPNFLFDCGLIDEFPVSVGDFQAPAAGFFWSSQGYNASNNASMEISGSPVDKDGHKRFSSRKRARPDSCSATGSKACREKMRRDMLNDRFLELASILEPGKPPKMDKAAILTDAVRAVTQLRSEAQKLKESNENLQEKIKELKAEKNELRDEKQKLKAEKEQLEQQVKAMTVTPNFVPHPAAIPATFAAQGQAAAGNKLMPFISYPGVAMWQFMPPAAVDTSQDHVLRPPVA